MEAEAKENWQEFISHSSHDELVQALINLPPDTFDRFSGLTVGNGAPGPEATQVEEGASKSASMRLTVCSCAGELAVLDADPSWQLRDLLAAIPHLAHEGGHDVRILLDTVELKGSATLSDIGASSGAVLTAVWNSLRILTCNGHEAKLWSASSGECVLTMDGQGTVVSATFSVGNATVMTISNVGKAKVWSVLSGECLQTFSVNPPSRWLAKPAALSPDGHRVLILSPCMVVKMCSVMSGDCLFSLEGAPKMDVWSVDFAQDGGHVLTACERWVKIHSGRFGDCLRTLMHDFRHEDEDAGKVWYAVFSPDSEKVLTCTRCSARVWSVSSGECFQTFNIADFEIEEEEGFHAVFALDSQRLLVEAAETLEVRCLVSQECVKMTIPGTTIFADISPDGQFVLTVSDEGDVKLRSVASGKPLRKFRGDEEEIFCWARFSPDGQLAFTVSDDGVVKIWFCSSGTLLCTLQCQANDQDVWRGCPAAFSHGSA